MNLAQGLLNFSDMRQIEALRKAPGVDAFDYPTLDEIICLWQSFRCSGLRAEEAWNAIVAGIALDRAFAARVAAKWVVQ